MNDFCACDARPAHVDDGPQGTVAQMIHPRDNIEIYTQFVACTYVFRQEVLQPGGLNVFHERLMRVVLIRVPGNLIAAMGREAVQRRRYH